jgi:phospholipase C
MQIDRRSFIGLGAGVAATAALAACSNGSDGSANGTNDASPSTRRGTGARTLRDPKDAPFDHVVILMMENRSFDHLLGWLPGAEGEQAGLAYPDLDGTTHPTWDNGDDWQGCRWEDPGHQWPQGQKHLNGGKGDGFLFTQVREGETTPIDLWPISYYGPDALPILGTLAREYTTFDHYFAALNAGTWPNRLYQIAAATDVDVTGTILSNGVAIPGSKIQTTIWDRAKDAGLTSGYFHWGEPMTSVFDSKKYEDITHPIDDFFTAAKAGTLPNITFVEPDYTSASEFMGTSNDMHPHGSIRVGDGFIQRVYKAVTQSPQWDKTVLVVNFDEWGGFYDHVVPPNVSDDNVNPNPGPHPDYSQLGFRVPCVLVSPWSPKAIVHEGPYEHCSVLRMIEWRWGLEPMSTRDKTAKNLAEQLDFSLRRPPVKLPAFDAPEPTACPAGSAF